MEQRQLVSNNISYSLLKSFDENGPKVLVETKKVYTKSLDYGSKVDDFITMTKEEFNNNYLVVQNVESGDLFKLAEFVVKANINLKEIAYIGDELVDVKAFGIVGRSIAFNADKKEVKNAADIVVDSKNLKDILEHLN